MLFRSQRWRFSVAELEERDQWDQYLEAYEQAINATSTADAPWYILPADHAWAASLLAAEILTEAIQDRGVDYPKVTEEGRADLLAARQQLENEG